MNDNPEDSLLAITLDAAVPFRIHEYAERGGPSDADRERLQGAVDPGGHYARPLVLDDAKRAKDRQPILDAAGALAERGDVLLYGGGRKGEVAALFATLTDALAVMSFVPGGVRFCGRRWLASAGWPYQVLDSEVKESPGVVLESHGRRVVARFRRDA